jgi:hypothetical protein
VHVAIEEARRVIGNDLPIEVAGDISRHRHVDVVNRDIFGQLLEHLVH